MSLPGVHSSATALWRLSLLTGRAPQRAGTPEGPPTRLPCARPLRPTSRGLADRGGRVTFAEEMENIALTASVPKL